ncbi:exopolysaccharide Pel transporter PelG [Streptococcus sp. 121]|uniref:exopolysaccharide Pel transporter PelG n=1 Tax=Streptococcus sp. 121 TaxID=2797637 RepID=UPI0018F0BF17|nr:exopolysaccharide Pel transporter PelG [Streptococcus sp. 121]MBJ6746490.1 exopolysaccharide Pel transporter PelG [Streptococcus sp. 121]
MAGIGFELRKIYDEQTPLSKEKAYGFTSLIYVGPFLLGLFLVGLVQVLAQFTLIDASSRMQVLTGITYAMLASLGIQSFFSYLVSRYLADSLYQDREDQVLSSFFASSVLLLLLGTVIYGIFLLFAGLGPWAYLLNLLLFGVLTLIWNSIQYLTAIQEYRSISKAFVLAAGILVLTGGLASFFGLNQGLLLGACLAYGFILIRMVGQILLHYPSNHRLSFDFLRRVDDYADLAPVGPLLFLGLYGHIVVALYSPLSQQVTGLFRQAPGYEFGLLLAFLLTLFGLVTYVISVEVFFYPHFHRFFLLYNKKGNYLSLQQAEREMMRVLQRELGYLIWKQVIATSLLMVGLNLLLLPMEASLPVGSLFLLNQLCLAYGIYGIANAYLLTLLYFADYRGAKQLAQVFATLSLGLTGLLAWLAPAYLGCGFLLASLILTFLARRRLGQLQEQMTYHVLGRPAQDALKTRHTYTNVAQKLEEIFAKFE